MFIYARMNTRIKPTETDGKRLDFEKCKHFSKQFQRNLIFSGMASFHNDESSSRSDSQIFQRDAVKVKVICV